MRYRWPNDAQCAVVLSFDVDAESGYVYRFPKEAASELDQMEERRFGSGRASTGSCGCWRSTSCRRRSSCRATRSSTTPRRWRRSTRPATRWPATATSTRRSNTLDEEAERRILNEQLAIYEKHLGIRPTGYRSPSWSLNMRTPALLKEHGFFYDSSLMGDDIPYFVGTPHGELAEIPVQWLLDDAPFYRHVYGATNAIADPDRVIRLWTQEFQGMYQENGAFVLTMHPWISGRAGRLLGLEQLIRAIKAEPGVWWATCKQVAEWQIETRQNLDVTVPISEASA